MQERYTVTSRFETDPTGEKLDAILPQLVAQLKTRETVTADGVVSEREIRPVVSKANEQYFVTVKSEYGQQEDGFLIEIEVEGRDGFNQEDAQAILGSLKATVNQVFDGINKTR